MKVAKFMMSFILLAENFPRFRFSPKRKLQELVTAQLEAQRHKSLSIKRRSEVRTQ